MLFQCWDVDDSIFSEGPPLGWDARYGLGLGRSSYEKNWEHYECGKLQMHGYSL